jgi:hypothetical protein
MSKTILITSGVDIIPAAPDTIYDTHWMAQR